MTRTEILKYFAEALEVPMESITENSSPETVETWDSTAWLGIIAMIDEKFGVTIDMDRMQELQTIGGILDELEGKGLLTV